MFPRVPLANKWQKAPSSGRSDKESISPFFFNEEDDDKSPSLVNPRVCCLNGFVRSNKSRLHVVLSSESKRLLKDEPLLREKGGGGQGKSASHSSSISSSSSGRRRLQLAVAVVAITVDLKAWRCASMAVMSEEERPS